MATTSHRITRPSVFRRHQSAWAGLATVIAIGAVIALALVLFQGGLTRTVTVTVLSPRAGLVMNTDADVKMRGVTVGSVSSIESLPNGEAKLQLAMIPSQLRLIPANVGVDITSTTVFGAKYVQLVPPATPSTQPLAAGAVLRGDHVSVEVNTLFERLTGLLDAVDPAQLNETLSGLSQALNGRGRDVGQVIDDFDQFLTKQEATYPTLSADLAALPPVLGAYADAAPDLLRIADNSTKISRTIVDEQKKFDVLLLSAMGLADVGNEVLTANQGPLADVLRMLVPTSGLLFQYLDSVSCTLQGLVPFTEGPVLPEPGLMVQVGFTLGAERYRYPGDLPKVAAKTAVPCADLGMPRLKPGEVADYVVLDTGANPFKYGNQGIHLNTDGLKQMLFGPIDGPPRNSSQIGMPG
ncbi:MCE family protein [Mycolicibacterium sp. 018/SC-01/001]|uniref:MCE family protein n=1 Tax=Mycolicibacterium sp. 018/SC-01/001 TaxID=2592069 RepID=UPI00117DD4D1|nr:MCE family protein [Mycolicibacterium sp. 018/SC-01/001]TRW80236.1 MCE family protein [Mycolicibacterium sp. 018/SC-01/001]